MFFDIVVMSLYVLLRPITSRVCAKVRFNCSVNKRLFSTTMACSNDEIMQKKTLEKEENLLSKRFLGLEKNIW